MSTPEYVYAVRTCQPSMISHGGFQWPSKGIAKAPDWINNIKCGNGLHACLLNSNSSDYDYLDIMCEPSKVYMVLKINKKNIVYLGGKIKFPQCTVVFVGNRYDVANYIKNKLDIKILGKNNIFKIHDYTIPTNDCINIKSSNNAAIYNIGSDHTVKFNTRDSHIVMDDNNTVVIDRSNISMTVNGDNNTIFFKDYYGVVYLNGNNNNIMFNDSVSIHNKMVGVNNKIITPNKVTTLTHKMFQQHNVLFFNSHGAIADKSNSPV